MHEICPEQFIIKVPYTPEGLIGARRLRDAGIRINFTLEFSARENVVVTRVARPDYLNVFLGRIGAFMIDNKLGDGSGAGEMAVIASQNWVTAMSAKNQWQKIRSLRIPRERGLPARRQKSQWRKMRSSRIFL